MVEGNPVNLSYETPSGRLGKPGPAYLVSRLISSYIGYALVMAVLVIIVPKFDRVLMDFKVRIPVATLVLLQVSRACVKYYLWGALIPLPAIWALVNLRVANPRTRRALRLAAFVIVVVFLVFTTLALFIPLSGLVSTTA